MLAHIAAPMDYTWNGSQEKPPGEAMRRAGGAAATPCQLTLLAHLLYNLGARFLQGPCLTRYALRNCK